MERMKMCSRDNVAQNIEAVGRLFPHALTEVMRDGKLVQAIDFDVLRQELSREIVEGREERYAFTWPDKRQAILAANASIAATLRPIVEDSVGRDGTAGSFDSENLYIEGDNLDVLKLLQETYLGKVKMIYIDPPYNTGNDAFVYDDDFAMEGGDFVAASKVYDADGNRTYDFRANNESNGRFHTDWLNMIYPRLRVAKSLLADDGVIFISIDDNEVHNLRKVCDEIFGEGNFVADLSVVNNLKGRNDKKYIARANDRILMYVKSQDYAENGLPLSEDILREYKEKDDKGQYRLIELRKRGGQDTRADRPNMYYPLYVDSVTGAVSMEENDVFSCKALPIKSNGVDGRWRWGRETAKKNIDHLFGRLVGNKYNIYEKDYLEGEDGARRIRPKSVLWGASYSTDVATKEYRTLMEEIDFTNPKPVSLLSDIIIYATNPNEDSIILDFFSGSATTAHAVFLSNFTDGGQRRFIMVQLPEATDEGGTAYKAGYRNICEIGKERIRRAGAKIAAEAGEKAAGIDLGFRCLRLDTSNMTDVYYAPDAVTQDGLFAQVDNVKADRTPEDLLVQTMLDLGILLSASIAVEEIAGKRVFNVADGFLLACFDRDVTDETVTAIAKRKPYYAVFRDASMADDSALTNFDQLFAAYSPATVRRVL